MKVYLGNKFNGAEQTNFLKGIQNYTGGIQVEAGLKKGMLIYILSFHTVWCVVGPCKVYCGLVRPCTITSGAL